MNLKNLELLKNKISNLKSEMIRKRYQMIETG